MSPYKAYSVRGWLDKKERKEASKHLRNASQRDAIEDQIEIPRIKSGKKKLSRKEREQWCRATVGRKHQWNAILAPSPPGAGTKTFWARWSARQKCIVCGKQGYGKRGW